MILFLKLKKVAARSGLVKKSAKLSAEATYGTTILLASLHKLAYEVVAPLNVLGATVILRVV